MTSPLDKLRGLALAMIRQGVALRLTQVAANLAFLSLLALVPVISLAFSVMSALPMFGRMRDALQKFLASNLFLPGFADTVVRYVNQFAAKASELSLFGAVVFFATAFSALLTLDRALNLIWAAERPRSWARRITLYWTLLTLGPLVLAASLAVNGILFNDWLSGLPTRDVQRVWLRLLPWLLGLGGLTLLYRLVPNVPVRWREALAGGLLAAIGIEVLRAWLGSYVAKLPTYTVVYGAFAALPLFLIWMFTLWATVLLGALLAANLRYWGGGLRIHLAWTPAQRYAGALQVLLDLCAAQRIGESVIPAVAWRTHFAMDAGRAEAAARLLVAAGYLHRHWRVPADGRDGDPERAVWDEHWALAAPPATLTRRALFEAVWHARGPEIRGALRRPRGDVTDVPAMQRIDAPSLDLPLAADPAADPAVAAEGAGSGA